MKCRFVFAVLCSSLLLLLIASSGAADGQWSEPILVNKLVTHVESPTFAPGNPAVFSFLLTNPFPYNISEIEVIAQPYLLVYENGDTDWSGLVDPPTMINATANSSTIEIASLASQGNVSVSWSIFTTSSTSRGSMFAQSVYLVKLALSFDVSGKRISYTSRGYFTDDQWNILTGTANRDPTKFNTTYLMGLGYSGIIPDASFIVRDEIPLWPAFAIVGVACVTGTLATYNYLKGNPMASLRTYAILVKARRAFMRILIFRRKQ